MKSSEGKYREGAAGQRPGDTNIWKLGVEDADTGKETKKGKAVRKQKSQKSPRGQVKKVDQAKERGTVPSPSKVR